MSLDDLLPHPCRPPNITGMDVVGFRPEHSQLVYTFGGAAPVMRVRPGTVLQLWSEDAFNHALTSVDDVASKVLDFRYLNPQTGPFYVCLLYTSDAADDLLCVDLGGRRIIKKKK